MIRTGARCRSTAHDSRRAVIAIGASCWRVVRVVSLSLLAGLGCVNQTPHPALIEQPSDASLRVLTKAASQLLEDRKVTLAANAFTQSPVLSLAPAISNTRIGRLATGRVRGLPPELRLVRVGRRCELQHLESLQRVGLPGVNCRTLK